MRKASEASTSGRVQLRLTASSASAAATSIAAIAAANPRKASLDARQAWRSRSKASVSSASAQVGRRSDPRLEIDEGARGEAQGAGRRLAVDEARIERRLQKRLAVRLRDLDVIAEKVVVFDPELPNSVSSA